MLSTSLDVECGADQCEYFQWRHPSGIHLKYRKGKPWEHIVGFRWTQ